MIVQTAIDIMKIHQQNVQEQSADDEAFEMAIDALEKQIPIAPLPAELDITGCRCIPCGNCGTSINTMWDYCPWCGQRIEQ